VSLDVRDEDHSLERAGLTLSGREPCLVSVRHSRRAHLSSEARAFPAPQALDVILSGQRIRQALRSCYGWD
jgi:hypothetical protein